MPFVIALLVFGILVVLIVLLRRQLLAQQEEINQRLEQYVRLRSAAEAADEGGRPRRGQALIRNVSRHFETLQWSRLLEHKLIQAAIPMRGAEFSAVCCGLAAAFALCLLLLSSNLLLAVLGAAVGASIPLLVLNRKIRQRRKAFNEQLGDTIVLIANSLRTGYSFLQAVEMVSREMAPPVGEEFARVLKEMNLGVTTEAALNNMAKRINSEDLDLVITAVIIQRQVGGNLAVILDSIASTIRERIKIKGQIRTMTAQGRISGLIIGILPLALGAVIYLFNPGYIKILFTHPAGKMMLIMGAVSQVIGMLIIRKIIDIEL